MRISIRERLNRLTELRNRQNTDYHVDHALEAISISMENIADIKALVETPGWQIIASTFRKDIENKEAGIVKMAADPVQNQLKMIINYAVLKTLKRILLLVRGTLNEEQYLQEQEEQLRQQKGTENGW